MGGCGDIRHNNPLPPFGTYKKQNIAKCKTYTANSIRVFEQFFQHLGVLQLHGPECQLGVGKLGHIGHVDAAHSIKKENNH